MQKIIFLMVLAALSLPGVALAVNIFSARDLPVRYMTDEDRDMLKAAAGDALERNRDGDATHWENPKTGAHGDLTPLASFEREGRRCRDLDVANSARGRDNRLTLTLCRQDDGDWKIEAR